ncbi:alpha/beta hydrolase fold [Lentzea albidocapillata subsp. violacea]|uniref:Alpha/beta hydrolase fold n=2 Tax=Lentzea albidocapillata TaxID=40571 RepID=A0A1G9WV43_9PSEU|nr:alpha/beta hydrolase fold [Lentzea albidocapillata subsp. violacea]
MPPIAWQACGLRDALTDAGYEVISYAARGVAPSDAPPPPYTIEQMAGDAAGLLDALDVRDAALVGYSLGSFTVELLARTRPDLARCAVLVAGAGPVTPLLSAVLAMEAELITTVGHIPDTAAAFQTLMTGLAPTPLRDDEGLVSQWVQMLGYQRQMWTSKDGENGQSTAACSWLHDEHRMAALRNITIPVLVASFEHDVLFPPRTGRIAAEALPHGEFTVVRGAAHAGVMTHPGETIEAVIGFLSRT